MKKIDHRTAYKEGTTKWILCNKNLRNLSIEEIASILGISVSSLYAMMRVIRKETGYKVPYKI